MASPFLNMLSYWFFLMASVVMFSSLFVETGPASGGWTIYPPLSALGDANLGSKAGMDFWIDGDGVVCGIIIVGWLELYFHDSEHAYKGYEYDQFATDHLGLVLYRDTGRIIIPCFAFRIYLVVV